MAMHGSGVLLAVMLAATGSGRAPPPPDSALFNADGKAEAYLSSTDDMTIYLWGGEPVAYVQTANGGKDDVFGFNGKHLGWLSDEVIWGHDGKVACAEKSAISEAVAEPAKPLRQLRPLKSFTEPAPAMPTLSDSFSATSCGALLATGAR